MWIIYFMQHMDDISVSCGRFEAGNSFALHNIQLFHSLILSVI